MNVCVFLFVLKQRSAGDLLYKSCRMLLACLICRLILVESVFSCLLVRWQFSFFFFKIIDLSN